MFAFLKEPSHLLLLVVVLVLVFGAARLPSIAKNLGESMKVFKREVKELKDDDQVAPTVVPQPTSPQGAAPSGSPVAPAAPAPEQPQGPAGEQVGSAGQQGTGSSQG